MFKKFLLGSAVAFVAASGIAVGVGGNVAHASSTTVTAVTNIVNRPDNGNGGTWAYDGSKTAPLQRTLTVTVAADQAGVANGFTKFDATITDKGSFTTVLGALAPNQVVPGVKIAHQVKGSVNGTYSLTVVAPSTDALTGVVPATEDDNFAAPAATNTTSNWPKLAFASADNVVVTGGAYSWTYVSAPNACEKWVDSSANGDGNLAGDGNITGKLCFVPLTFPYGGNAHYVAPTREIVNFKSSLPAWYEFKITGPGAINGHLGWVHALGGGAVNTGVYSGLEGGASGHGYSVTYTPVVAQGSSTPLPLSHGGYVFFITNQPQTA